MKWFDYVQWTVETAKYKGVGEPNAYVRLGLVDEAGEVCGKVKKFLRDNTCEEKLKEDLLAECGDVFWYLARYLQDWRILEDEIKKIPHAPNRSYKLEDLPDLALIVSTECCDIMASSDIKEMSFYSKYVYRYLQAILSAVDLTVYECLKYNKEKLMSRKSRDKISGSGDNR